MKSEQDKNQEIVSLMFDKNYVISYRKNSDDLMDRLKEIELCSRLIQELYKSDNSDIISFRDQATPFIIDIQNALDSIKTNEPLGCRILRNSGYTHNFIEKIKLIRNEQLIQGMVIGLIKQQLLELQVEKSQETENPGLDINDILSNNSNKN